MDFSKINEIYNVKDAQARSDIKNINNNLKSINEKIENLLFGELGGALVGRTYNNYIPGVSSESTSQPPLGYMQGMTTTPTSIIIAIRPAAEYETTSNLVCLMEITKGTSNVTRKQYLTGYHANALAYNPDENEVYIACNSTVSGGETTPNNNIIVLDYTTWNVKETITPPTAITSSHRVRSVSYDPVSKTVMLGDESTCFIMQNWTTVGQTIELDMTDTLPIPATTNVQTLKHYNGLIFQSRMNPSGICVYDMSGHLVRNYFDLQVVDNIATGEMEDISIEADGKIYYATCQVIRYNQQIFTFDYTIFESNIYTGGFKRQPYQTQKGNYLQAYVDNTSTALQLGTADSPFGTPNQGLLMANSIPMDCGIRLNVQTGGDYGWFGGVFGNQPIYLDGNDNCTLHALLCLASRLIVDSVTITATPFVNINTGANPANVYIAQKSAVEIRNSTLQSGTTKQNNAMMIADSEVYVNATTIKGYTNAFRLQTNAKLRTYNITLQSNDYYYYCNTPDIEIFDGTISTWTNCNPSGYLPDDTTEIIKNIKFEQSGNTVTINNPKTIANKTTIITVSWKYQETSTHYFSFINTGGNSNVMSGFGTDTYQTVFNLSLSASASGTFSFKWSLKQQPVAGGAWNDLTSGTTFKVVTIRTL